MSAALNPFPGLRPFREDEEYLFFGREAQVDSMVDKLAATRFLAVVGSSGSGKSSLVNCGLRPALHRGLMVSAGSSWRMAQFRPGGDPLAAMATALAADGLLYSGYRGEVPLAEVIATRLSASKRGLVDLWAKAQPPAGTNLLVVVDQFEELFRFRGLGAAAADAQATVARATAFVNLLLEARQQPGCRIHVVITMRSDFLGECAAFYGLPEAINAGQYLVPRLTREERRAAITGPIGVGGAEIDPVLLTRLLNDVGDNPDQLSILQHALNRTWALWEDPGGRSGPLALAHYEASGTMARALDLHAESAYAELSPARQAVCERALRALTDKGTDARGIRRPTTLRQLCLIAAADESEVRAVVDSLRAPALSFLMPPASEALAADTVIDISHESLMRVWKRLQQWADDEAQSANLFRRLAQTAQMHTEAQAELLRGPELERALDWQRKARPNAAWAQQYGGGFDITQAFLQDSAAARQVALDAQHRRQLQRRWLVALTGLGLVVLTIYLYASRAETRTLLEVLSRAQKAGEESQAAMQANSLELRRNVEALVASEAAARISQEQEATARAATAKALAAAMVSAAEARKSEAETRAARTETEAMRLALLDARMSKPVVPAPAPASAPPRAAAARSADAGATPTPAALASRPAPPDESAKVEPAAAPPAPPLLIPGVSSPAVTEAQLLAIMPRLQRHRSGPTWLQALNAAMAEYDITTATRRAAFLAQVAYETTELRNVEESWSGNAFQQRYEPPNELAKRLGNTEPGDGKRYRGRGLIQVTGRSNYATYGALLGIDLVARPESATEPFIAARLAGAFWKQRGLNALADAEDLQGITRRINGGLSGLEERQRYLDLANAALRP